MQHLPLAMKKGKVARERCEKFLCWHWLTCTFTDNPTEFCFKFILQLYLAYISWYYIILWTLISRSTFQSCEFMYYNSWCGYKQKTCQTVSSSLFALDIHGCFHSCHVHCHHTIFVTLEWTMLMGRTLDGYNMNKITPRKIV